jgi:hypothetical protein
MALKAAHRLHAALALGFLALQIGAGGVIDAAARDGDDVQGAVELPVATVVEAMAVASPRGCGNWSDARHSEVCVAGVALGGGSLANQDRGSKRAAAGLR